MFINPSMSHKHFETLMKLAWKNNNKVGMTYLVFKSSDLEVFCEKCMIKSLKNSQETPLQGPLFKKNAGLQPLTLSNKRSWHWCYSVNWVRPLQVFIKWREVTILAVLFQTIVVFLPKQPPRGVVLNRIK